MKYLILFLFIPLLSPAQSLDWQVQDIEFSTGDTVTADFSAYGFNQITAYQFAMIYDTGALVFVGVTFPPGNPIPMGLSDGCFSWHGKPGYNVKPKELRHPRSMPAGKTYADGTHGFSYIFTSKQNGTLSDKVTFSTCCLYPPLNPISYRWILTPQPLTVAYIAPEETTATDTAPLEERVRIYPNPATDCLYIESDNPVQVRIFNFSGQLTHEAELLIQAIYTLDKGANLVWVTDGKETLLKTVIKE